MNDNHPPGVEGVIAKHLARTAAMEELLTVKLPELLKANGAPPAVITAVEQLLEPALNLLEEDERHVIAALRDTAAAKVIGEGFDALTKRMKTFATAFAAAATTPEQHTLVGQLREYVDMAQGNEHELDWEL